PEADDRGEPAPVPAGQHPGRAAQGGGRAGERIRDAQGPRERPEELARPDRGRAAHDGRPRRPVLGARKRTQVEARHLRDADREVAGAPDQRRGPAGPGGGGRTGDAGSPSGASAAGPEPGDGPDRGPHGRGRPRAAAGVHAAHDQDTQGRPGRAPPAHSRHDPEEPIMSLLERTSRIAVTKGSPMHQTSSPRAGESPKPKMSNRMESDHYEPLAAEVLR